MFYYSFYLGTFKRDFRRIFEEHAGVIEFMCFIVKIQNRLVAKTYRKDSQSGNEADWV